MFACLNAFIIPIVYFFFPETAVRSLEGMIVSLLSCFCTADSRTLTDMDVVFALAYNEGVSPVEVSLRKDVPPAGSAEADEILGITGRDTTSVREHSGENWKSG